MCVHDGRHSSTVSDAYRRRDLQRMMVPLCDGLRTGYCSFFCACKSMGADSYPFVSVVL